MVDVSLNLTRKWRSKTFDQVVGQSMPIRMLKNSLYLNQFFPVYMFSGQHGCGKTSTARVFAAALNCQQLPVFRQKPREQVIPCLSCDSCIAMSQGRHPDFFEIDAASHTGVDNVRQIIESAALLPIMGSKKIYLIDEAHMLSKAAFNALLKILEEPPASVLFILATTDTDKIIETVKSRCFQLFFSPIKQDDLVAHLAQVCDRENIAYQQDGLRLIADESKGSARDAINMLEQVRFSSGTITKDSVARVIGRIDDAALIDLVATIVTQDVRTVAQAIKEINFAHYSAQSVWERLIALVRALVWVKYDAPLVDFVQHKAVLKKIVSQCSMVFLQQFMHALQSNEMLFSRTTSKHALLEMILLQLAYKKGGYDGGGSSASPQSAVMMPDEQLEDAVEDIEDDQDDEDEEAFNPASRWRQFISVVEKLRNSLLVSIVKQAQFVDFCRESNKISVVLTQGQGFFSDILASEKEQWQPLLHDVFGTKAELVVEFKQAARQEPMQRSVMPKAVQPSGVQQPKNSVGSRLDIQDTEKWPLTHMLLRHFPGQVYEMKNGV